MMTTFGEYSKSEKKHYLEKDPERYWIFKYPTAEDEVAAERFMRGEPSTTEIFIFELATTFAGTNIGEEEEAYILPDMPLGVRQTLISKMPLDLIHELARSLNDFAPSWGLAKRKKKDNS